MNSTNRLLTCLISEIRNLMDREIVRLDDVCVNVDGVPTYVQPVVTIEEGVVISTVYFDAMGNQVTGVVTFADPCDCPCLECDDCFANLLSSSTNCGLTTCGVLRVDATPGSLSQSTFETFTLELTDMAGSCPATNISFAGQTLSTVTTPSGDAIENFATTINSLPGFEAMPCGETDINEYIAVKGPDCYSWELWLRSGGSGDDYALGYNHLTNELYEIEQPQGSAIIGPFIGDGSATSNGFYPARNCGICNF